MFLTTPTTTRSCSNPAPGGGEGGLSFLPSGFCPGQHSLASRSLTTTVCWPGTPSSLVSNLPAISGTPTVRKIITHSHADDSLVQLHEIVSSLDLSEAFTLTRAASHAGAMLKKTPAVTDTRQVAPRTRQSTPITLIRGSSLR